MGGEKGGEGRRGRPDESFPEGRFGPIEISQDVSRLEDC